LAVTNLCFWDTRRPVHCFQYNRAICGSLAIFGGLGYYENSDESSKTEVAQMNGQDYRIIDEYIAAQSEELRPLLHKVRETKQRMKRC